MIQETSLESYEDIRKKLSGRAAEILARIEESAWGLPAFEIAHLVNRPKPWVMPDITHLKKLGLVLKSSERLRDPDTGKRGIIWKRAYPDTQRRFW